MLICILIPRVGFFKTTLKLFYEAFGVHISRPGLARDSEIVVNSKAYKAYARGKNHYVHVRVNVAYPAENYVCNP